MNKSLACPVLFTCAVEASGDALLAKVLASLISLRPNLVIKGVFGPKTKYQLQQLGIPVKSVIDVEPISVNGISDVLLRAPSLFKAKKKVFNFVKSENFDAALLVDYPGFNVGLQKHFQSRRIPTLFLAPPQAWAYRKRNLSPFRGHLFHVLYPFEKEAYEKVGAKVTQGHFLDSLLNNSVAKNGTAPQKKHILLCPGSRPKVIERNLAPMLKWVLKSNLYQNTPISVLVPEASGVYAQKVIDSLGEKRLVQLYLDRPDSAERELAMGSARRAICLPGTFSMELVWAGVPMECFLVVDFATYIAGRILLKTAYLCMANRVLEREAFSESVFIQWPFGILAWKHRIETNFPANFGNRNELQEKLGLGHGNEIVAIKLESFLRTRRDFVDF